MCDDMQPETLNEAFQTAATLPEDQGPAHEEQQHFGGFKNKTKKNLC